MLTSLLPGVRQLRAPFAAGAVTLASAYLLLYPVMAKKGGAVDPAVESLLDFVGRGGLVATVAVAAYLLGTIILVVVQVAAGAVDHSVLQRSLTNWREGRKDGRWRFFTPFSRSSVERLDRTCHGDEQLLVAVCRNILTGNGKRLMVKSESLYGEFDRLRSEVDFRHALAIPIVLLAVAFTLRVEWGALIEATMVVLVVGADIVLLLQARILSMWSYSLHAHAVADGVVSTPALDQARLNFPESAKQLGP